MKKIIVLLMAMAALGCSTKSAKDADIKDQSLKTERDKSESVAGTMTLGVNEDQNIVVQDKIQLTEHLRQLVTTVKHKQDELYGSKRFGTRGLYGKLERCVGQVSKKNKDGVARATLVARDMVVSETELGDLEAGRFGYDEKGQLVALDEAKLRDKIRDLESKKRRLYEKEEELLVELSRCEAQLN